MRERDIPETQTRLLNMTSNMGLNNRWQAHGLPLKIYPFYRAPNYSNYILINTSGAMSGRDAYFAWQILKKASI